MTGRNWERWWPQTRFDSNMVSKDEATVVCLLRYLQECEGYYAKKLDLEGYLQDWSMVNFSMSYCRFQNKNLAVDEQGGDGLEVAEQIQLLGHVSAVVECQAATDRSKSQ